jgi:7-cyano-7-deazaguanine synthase
MDAIVLLSGGIDSCVVLAYALDTGKQCHTLSFDYGQRHRLELQSAEKIAAYYNVEHTLVRVDPKIFAFSSQSALINQTLTVERSLTTTPNTYVPCRNLLFLSHAAALAESVQASEIFFGANAHDGPSYPDCTGPFFHAFEQAVAYGSRMARQVITCPLLDLDKAAIVALGRRLKAPLDLTWSCYDPQNGTPCMVCAACMLRSKSGA